MAGSILIYVVGSSVFKDDDQGDVEVEVVDWTTEIFFKSAGEVEAGAGMVGEIGVAGGDQAINFFLGSILQREIDVVGKHGVMVDSTSKGSLVVHQGEASVWRVVQ